MKEFTIDNVDELWDAMRKHNNEVRYYNEHSQKKTNKVIASLSRMSKILCDEFYNLDAGYAGGDVWYTFEIDEDYSVYAKQHISEDMEICHCMPDGTVCVYKLADIINHKEN